MKRLSLIFGLLLSSSLEAKTIFLASQSTNLKDYQAFVLSSPNYQFPSDYLIEHMPLASSREQLSQLFAEAQSSYLSGSLSDAATNFKKVADLSLIDQWSQEDQSVILHSLLRLAQLEHDPKESENWLRKAIVETPMGVVNESYFPPPLIEQYKSLQKSLPVVELDLSNLAVDFDHVFLNGRLMALKKQSHVTIPDAMVRATLFSNVYQTATIQMPARQLPRIAITKHPWLEGTCADFRNHWQEPGVMTKPYFSTACSVPKPKPVEVDIAYAPSSSAPTGISPLPLTMAPPMSEEKSKPLYKKAWFWIGVGAVVTAVVVASQMQSQNSSTTPSSHDGF